MERGLVLINTGSGKGKTTAALGVVLRALGQGLKVAFLQFIKNQETGESRFLREYAREHPDRLYYNRLGLGMLRDSPSEADRARAAEALAEARRLLADGYDLVALDEICVAAGRGVVPAAEVVRLIEDKPPAVHLILTGRGCPAEIMALADTVTEMVVIKHAFDQGEHARKGLEF